jgi:hypothetical protein
MHDLDRRTFEAEVLGGELDEAERQEEQEFRELLGELVRGGSGRADEFETYETHETVGSAGEFDDRLTREIALASELLEVQTTAELEQFLGGLLRRIAGGGRRFARSPTGRALGRVLKQAASQALPQVAGPPGAAAATMPDAVGGPADTPASELGLELGGLSAEDREFEVARAFVRFADEAARVATLAPPAARPADVARTAATTAAGRHLPGLLAEAWNSPRTRQHSGRWVRRGAEIVVDGA